MPRVSILLTCYNHLPYLPACVDAVLAQTFTDYEIVALDDGSTDGTREWLRARESEGKLRCVFNASNLGTYATLNVGLEEAKGELIAVLNDDDLWAPAKLQRQVEALDADERIGLVHTGGWFIDGKGERIEGAPLGFFYPRTGTGEVLHELIHHNKIIASSALVRRQAFDACGPFDPAFYGCGDWQMWLRIARQFRVAYIDEPLTFYRVHETNASRNTEKMLQDDDRIRQWITGWEGSPIEGYEHREELKRAFAHNWACIGTVRTRLGRTGEGRRAYLRSLRMMPYRLKSAVLLLLTFLPRKLFRRVS